MKFGMKKESGFSLVELMVVVGIIGILASLAIPKLQVFMARAKQSEAKGNLNSLNLLQQGYFVENSKFGTYSEIGASNIVWKVYTKPTDMATGANTFTYTATAANKLCPGATANDGWQITNDGVLSNSTNGLTGC